MPTRHHRSRTRSLVNAVAADLRTKSLRRARSAAQNRLHIAESSGALSITAAPKELGLSQSVRTTRNGRVGACKPMASDVEMAPRPHRPTRIKDSGHKLGIPPVDGRLQSSTPKTPGETTQCPRGSRSPCTAVEQRTGANSRQAANARTVASPRRWRGAEGRGDAGDVMDVTEPTRTIGRGCHQWDPAAGRTRERTAGRIRRGLSQCARQRPPHGAPTPLAIRQGIDTTAHAEPRDWIWPVDDQFDGMAEAAHGTFGGHGCNAATINARRFLL